MGDWKTVTLDELPGVLKEHYAGAKCRVGIDATSKVYYIVLATMDLDETLEIVKDSIDSSRIFDTIGVRGFPRGIMVWIGAADRPDTGSAAPEPAGSAEEESLFIAEEFADLTASLEPIVTTVTKRETAPPEPAPLPAADTGESEMDYLIEEVQRVKAQNVELEDSIAERDEEVTFLMGEVQSYAQFLQGLCQKFGADLSDLPEDTPERIKAVLEYITQAFNALQGDLAEQQKAIRQLEKSGGSAVPSADTERLQTELEALKKEKDDLTRRLADGGGGASGSPAADLVAADKAHTLAEVSQKEFNRMVEKEEIKPAAEGLFRRGDLLAVALKLYAEGTVPRRKYDMDIEAAREELSEGHGEGQCISMTAFEDEKKKALTGLEETIDALKARAAELDNRLKGFAPFFEDKFYDPAYVEKTIGSLKKIGLADEGLTVGSLVPATDNGQYHLPALIVRLVEHYDEITFLEAKVEELEQAMSSKQARSDDLNRKITQFEEKEQVLASRLEEENAKLAELDVVVQELEKTGLGNLRSAIQRLMQSGPPAGPSGQRPPIPQGRPQPPAGPRPPSGPAVPDADSEVIIPGLSEETEPGGVDEGSTEDGEDAKKGFFGRHRKKKK